MGLQHRISLASNLRFHPGCRDHWVLVPFPNQSDRWFHYLALIRCHCTFSGGCWAVCLVLFAIRVSRRRSFPFLHAIRGICFLGTFRPCTLLVVLLLQCSKTRHRRFQDHCPVYLSKHAHLPPPSSSQHYGSNLVPIMGRVFPFLVLSWRPQTT